MAVESIPCREGSRVATTGGHGRGDAVGRGMDKRVDGVGADAAGGQRLVGFHSTSPAVTTKGWTGAGQRRSQTQKGFRLKTGTP